MYKNVISIFEKKSGFEPSERHDGLEETSRYRGGREGTRFPENNDYQTFVEVWTINASLRTNL